ncbi:MAG: RNA polymerase sigma factor, partial [Nocardioidaceae bacterium]
VVEADVDPVTSSHEEAVVTFDEVWAGVTALSPRQRAVVVLRYYEQLSEAEIAELLNVRPGTVKSKCAAARANLRRLLGDRELSTNGEQT